MFRLLAAAAAVFLLGPLAAPPLVAAPPPVPSGADLFRQRCGMCHIVPAGKKPILGPSLAGVVGRRAGTGAFNYSPALQKSGIVWTRASLDKYLAAPTKMVPGTRMVIGINNPAERAALIDYLAGAGS